MFRISLQNCNNNVASNAAECILSQIVNELFVFFPPSALSSAGEGEAKEWSAVDYITTETQRAVEEESGATW